MEGEAGLRPAQVPLVVRAGDDGGEADPAAQGEVGEELVGPGGQGTERLDGPARGLPGELVEDPRTHALQHRLGEVPVPGDSDPSRTLHARRHPR